MTKPSPPIEKKEKFSPFPTLPKTQKKKKIECTDYISRLPLCLPEIFIMGQYPFITGWTPIVL